MGVCGGRTRTGRRRRRRREEEEAERGERIGLGTERKEEALGEGEK